MKLVCEFFLNTCIPKYCEQIIIDINQNLKMIRKVEIFIQFGPHLFIGSPHKKFSKIQTWIMLRYWIKENSYNIVQAFSINSIKLFKCTRNVTLMTLYSDLFFVLCYRRIGKKSYTRFSSARSDTGGGKSSILYQLNSSHLCLQWIFHIQNVI